MEEDKEDLFSDSSDQSDDQSDEMGSLSPPPENDCTDNPYGKIPDPEVCIITTAFIVSVLRELI